MPDPAARNRSRRLGPFLVFLLLGSLTVAEWKREVALLEGQELERFRKVIERASLGIEDRARSYEDALWAAKGRVLSADSELARGKWRVYTDTLRLQERYSGINGIGMGYYVRKGEVPAYLSRIRRLNSEPGFSVHPPSENQDHYPITYIEPLENNRQAVGLDLGFEKRRRQAMEKSRDLNVPTLTRKIQLVQDAYKRPGVLLVLPLYTPGLPLDTVEQRRRAYFGYVYAPFIISNFMGGLTDDTGAGMSLTLYDGENETDEDVLFRENVSTRAPASDKPRFSEATRIRFADRVWTARWDTTDAYVSSEDSREPLLVLFGGTIICVLISGWLGSLMRNRDRATELASKMTEELRLSQSKVIAASKFSALGEMAAGVAHEINNPLTVIQGYAGQLLALSRKGQLDPERIANAGEKLIKTSERIAKIVQGLRTYAREGSADPFESAPVGKIVEETLGFCQSRFKHHEVDLRVGSVPERLVIECREVQISQVLLNLLNNAFDAVRGTQAPWVSIEVLDQGPNVRIEITDSGSGIPHEVAEKIFQPFFTTKEVGKGTGLGLSLSIGICKQHHGALDLDRSCANTRFVVTLPKKQPTSAT